MTSIRGRVHSVTLTGQEIDGFLADRTPFQSYAADDPTLVQALRAKGVSITGGRCPGRRPLLGQRAGESAADGPAGRLCDFLHDPRRGRRADAWAWENPAPNR